MSQPAKKSLLLLILDGWGIADDGAYNAISEAETPQWDRWLAEGTHTTLSASGSFVGLPENQMGNSEVGHMHIGAGRTIKQDLTQISDDITMGSFPSKPVLANLLTQIKSSKNAIHIMGLLSAGGVHSHEQHLFAILDAISNQDIKSPVYIHAFLDGRDTPPNSGLESINRLQEKLVQNPNIKLASICGRFYAMDRDNRWERVEQAYQLLTSTQSQKVSDLEKFITDSYAKDVFDEFIPPTASASHQPIQNNDVVLFFNFRADRARELSQALTQPDFSKFERTQFPQISLVTMKQYEANLDAEVIYPSECPCNTLGECVAKANSHQLRIAETEKYAHVTFFLNGGRESPFQDEDRTLIPSPDVKTYDLKPEMSANKITSQLTEAILSEKYQLIVCNFANADMVGHTGQFEATKEAIEALDSCFVKINAALQASGTQLIVTADHGNAEKMFDESTQMPHTAHTHQPVPFVYIGEESMYLTKQTGILTDIAPTALYLMGLPIAKEMTGESLLTHQAQEA